MLAVTVPPSISADVIEIDNNLEVADGSWNVAATDGHVQIFGTSEGRIDGTVGQSKPRSLLAQLAPSQPSQPKSQPSQPGHPS